MAKGSSKRITSQNASSMTLLLRGFLISNASQLLSLTLLTSSNRRHSSLYKYDIAKYLFSEVVALAIAAVFRDMAKKGEDLSAEGLTSLMWDVVFVTWAVHVGTALIWRKIWWLYAVIPLYGLFLAYSKLVVPFVLGGKDPIGDLVSSLTGKGGASGARGGGAAAAANQQQQQQQQGLEPLSKRQQKLQARADKGDPRVQRREVKKPQ